MIAGFLETVGELDAELSILTGELSALRASYLTALETAAENSTEIVVLGREMQGKTEQTVALMNRIVSYFSDAIPRALRREP
jgi:hypothetical protein